MKATLLFKFLCEEIDIKQFKHKVDEEIVAFRVNLTHKKGSSLPISIEDDLVFTFKKEHLLKLCDHYLKDELDNVELEYVVDCITLREPDDYENEQLIYILDSMTDPKVNGEMTKEKMTTIKYEMCPNAFNQMHQNGDNKLLMNDIFEDENFEEWK